LVGVIKDLFLIVFFILQYVCDRWFVYMTACASQTAITDIRIHPTLVKHSSLYSCEISIRLGADIISWILDIVDLIRRYYCTSTSCH